MTLRIVAQDVRRFSLDELRPFARENPEFYDVAGREHYRLLAYLSTKVSGNIIDVGTHQGASALALSYNPENTVITFDIVEKTHPVVDRRSNVRRLIADLTNPCVRDKYRAVLLKSPLILIDVDPHDGEKERILLDWLRDFEYRGIVILDDVWHFKPLREKVWYQIPRLEKIDLTPVGHWSGTGLVQFNRGDRFCDVIFDEEPAAKDLDGWTLVTGYFDLTKEPDASPLLKTLSPSWFIEEHSTSTLSLEHDLVVFTEPEFAEAIWRKRPKWLHERTKVVMQSFADFPLYKYREKIWENRKGYHCARDPKNTASYYLYCMARSAMLKEAMNNSDTPFYAWINICVERMGIRNVACLDEALACRRHGFSTCRIAYAPVNPDNLGAFYGSGCVDATSTSTCGGGVFCSGFYSGDRETMKLVCDAMETEFVRVLGLGYGHADEQIIALVHAQRPELFNWYLGDYAQMITNYALVREQPEAPLRNLLLPAVAAGAWSVAEKVSAQLWDSYLNGKCAFTDSDLDALVRSMK